MTVLTRFLVAITLTLVSLVLLETHPATLGQNDASDKPHGTACEREIAKLGARRPTVWREVTSPMITRRVRPTFPTIPSGTTGGGVWIGEVLIDAGGRVLNVWTIREPKLTPRLPSVNKAVTDAVLKWEFAPAAVDKVPVPICQTVTVNVNLKVIRGEAAVRLRSSSTNSRAPRQSGRRAGPRPMNTGFSTHATT
jgi:hypothetical protein